MNKTLLLAMVATLSINAHAEVTHPNISYKFNDRERALISAANQGNFNRLDSALEWIKDHPRQELTLEGYLIAINNTLDRGDDTGLDMAFRILNNMNDPLILTNLNQYPKELSSILVKIAGYQQSNLLTKQIILDQLLQSPFLDIVDYEMLVEALNTSLDNPDQAEGLDRAVELIQALNQLPEYTSTDHHNVVRNNLGDALVKLLRIVQSQTDSNLSYSALNSVNILLHPKFITNNINEMQLLESLNIVLDKNGRLSSDPVEVSRLYRDLSFYIPPHHGGFFMDDPSEVSELVGVVVSNLVEYSLTLEYQDFRTLFEDSIFENDSLYSYLTLESLIEPVLISYNKQSLEDYKIGASIFHIIASNDLFKNNISSNHVQDEYHVSNDLLIKSSDLSPIYPLYQDIEINPDDVEISQIKMSIILESLDILSETLQTESIIKSLDQLADASQYYSSSPIFSYTQFIIKRLSDQLLNGRLIDAHSVPKLISVYVKLLDFAHINSAYSNSDFLDALLNLRRILNAQSNDVGLALDTINRVYESLITAIDGTPESVFKAEEIFELLFFISNSQHLNPVLDHAMLEPEFQNMIERLVMKIITSYRQDYLFIVQSEVRLMSVESKARAISVASALNNQAIVDILR